jgi:hypothetical protein
MKTLLSIAFAAVIAVTASASVAQADNATGSCNRIVANAMGPAQACWNFGCVPTDSECAEVGAALLGFFTAPGCGEAFTAGTIEGLPGNASVEPDGSPNAGEAKHVQDVICISVADCGFCGPAVAFGVCGPYCP